jgi:molybdopterin molybdotransferase
MRARILAPDGGPVRVVPGPRQDSSLLKALSESDGLVVRPPHAPPAAAGDPCRIIRLSRLGA